MQDNFLIIYGDLKRSLETLNKYLPKFLFEIVEELNIITQK